MGLHPTTKKCLVCGKILEKKFYQTIRFACRGRCNKLLQRATFKDGKLYVPTPSEYRNKNKNRKGKARRSINVGLVHKERLEVVRVES